MHNSLVHDRYYFLCSSLPELSIDSKPAISLEQFLEQCRYSLSPQDWCIIKMANVVPDECSIITSNNSVAQLLKRWYAFDVGVRNQLCILRANRLGWDASKWTRSFFFTSSQVVFESVKLAFEESVPIIAEKILYSLRWRYLDELQGVNKFNILTVIVYYLKLQLGIYWQAIEPSRGIRRFKKIYDSLRINNIYSKGTK